MKRTRLQIALGIISGRLSTNDLDSYHYEVLGFSYGKAVPEKELKERCEDIVYDLLEKLIEDE
jgi:hypothetical protein